MEATWNQKWSSPMWASTWETFLMRTNDCKKVYNLEKLLMQVNNRVFLLEHDNKELRKEMKV